ncbi:MAG: PaaR repeat-containing protein, partial [uncultured bacterium]
MSKVVRLGDPSDHGGQMVSASGKLRVNGINECIDGDIHSCPMLGHGDTAVTGTAKLTDRGKNVVHVGDTAGCGAVITQGSINLD